MKLQCDQLHWNACVQNWLSTKCPSFAAANYVTNGRVVARTVNGSDFLQVSSVQFSCAV